MSKAKKPVRIDGVAFDALIDEERTLGAEAPEYPVEEGFSVTDSIILKPLTLSMTICVTDTPVTWEKKGHGGKGWTDSVIRRLEALYFAKTPVTVETTERTYKNMAILSISVSKSADAGYARLIPITFREIRVTKSQKTTIPESYGKGGETGVNAGAASVSSQTLESSVSQQSDAEPAAAAYALAADAALLG